MAPRLKARLKDCAALSLAPRRNPPDPKPGSGACAPLPSSLTIDGEDIDLSVRINPRARRLILKIDPVTAGIILVLPRRSDLSHALDFAQRQGAWIASKRRECRPAARFAAGVAIPVRGQSLILTHAPDLQRRTVKPDLEGGKLLIGGPPDTLPRRVSDWLKAAARQDIGARVGAHAATLGVRPRRITIRDTRSRWGSCSADGALSFSWRLIMAPPDVLDYVAAHEVAHLRHHDHSPAFWAVVKHLYGDPRSASHWLKQHGTDLHRYGIG